MPRKFAPADSKGRKPWVRESYHMARTTSTILYAADRKYVKLAYRVWRGETITVRRATVEDLDTIRVDQNYKADR